MTSKELSKVGTDAVKRLRVQKLSEGFPFMINSNDLPLGQCYLEYPNGKIVLSTLSSESRDFVMIRELTYAEGQELRMKFDLEVYPNKCQSHIS